MTTALIETALIAPVERRPNLLAVLFTPGRAMDRQARIGAAFPFFLVVWIASIALGATLAYRVDARSDVLAKLEMRGELKGMSDRQIADEVKNDERVVEVLSIAKGVTTPPLELAGATLAIVGLAWFLRGRVKGSAVLPVAAASLLPLAAADLVDVVTALRHATLPPENVTLGPRTLASVLALAGRPLSPPWMKLGDAVDLFSLWSAILLAFGLVYAGQLPKRRAIAGTLVAWICYRLLTHVAIGGA
jgi:hypothetical protein